MSRVIERPSNDIAIDSDGTKSRSSGRSPLAVAQSIVQSPAFLPGSAVAVALLVAFWELIRVLPSLYLDSDGYYSHGLLIPLISGYVVYRRWPSLRTLEVKPSWWALIPLAGIIYVLRPATGATMLSVLSLLWVASILCGIWFVAGARWMFATAAPVIYLLLGLPVWSMAINTYTNPLQLLSTKVAYEMLAALRFQPYLDGTTINLNHFVLDVGVPCSGLKLSVALAAFSIFFILVANLKLWANLTLLVLILPLALFFNGLRIAMIGIVGETWGEAAGHSFHDYSGYLMLVICFVTLFKIARWLGWKD
jgi:exosortase